MQLKQLSPSHSINKIEHTTLRAQQSHSFPLLYLDGREGSSFSGYVSPNDMVDSKSVVGVKPCDFVVVIGYQVDEFTHTLLVECFCSITNLSQVYRQGVNYRPLPS